MPYWLSSDDRSLLKKLRLTHVCSVCGGKLEAFYDLNKHLPYLACKTNPEHEGIGKPNKSEDNSYIGGMRQMVEVEKQYGVDKARQVARYQGVTSLSRDQAMEILETIWPDAPASDKLAAAMLCASYQLNPLANHVFLVPFQNRETGEITWSRMLGIRAKRLMARRGGNYAYLDMSPRLMTNEEQIKVWGAIDQANLCYLTWLKDTKTGAEVYGYGIYPKTKKPKGTENGNSQANMASIRSESQALDRLRPAEMPSGFIAIDENYIDAEVREVIDPAKATSTPEDAQKSAIEEHTEDNTSLEEEATKSKIPNFKTAAELFNYALSHRVSLEVIKQTTGYANPLEVVDLKAAIKALYP